MDFYTNSYGNYKIEPKFKDGWGDMIRDLRIDRGYTQQDIADILNVTKGTVSRWEKEIMVPNVILAIKLSHILKVDVESIFYV